MLATTRHLLTGVLLALAVALTAPAGALAHGDPSSHYLEAEPLYPGIANRPSQALELRLLGLLQATAEAGYPIKVAIVGAPEDLTDDPDMIRTPQRYAEFVVSELAPTDVRAPVAVVTPYGVGVAGVQMRAGRPVAVGAVDARRLAGDFAPARNARGDDLARAAMAVVRRVAAAGGHPLPPRVPAAKVLALTAEPNGGGIGGWLPFLIFGAVFVSAWLCFEARIRLARRRSGGTAPATATNGTGGAPCPTSDPLS